MISMAAQKKPALVMDGTVAYYDRVTERCAMRLKLRVMLKAMINSGCDAVVVSAFGCGAFKHPPEEVAKLFKDEIETAGPGFPSSYSRCWTTTTRSSSTIPLEIGKYLPGH